MEYTIRSFVDGDIDDIVELSLLAWEPIFVSFSQILGSSIYTILYPDWRKSQQEGIETIYRDRSKYNIIVAQSGQNVIGFLAYELKKDNQSRGEVILLAVHPDYQNDGIGTELNKKALEDMKEAGVKMAVVETGGDESHAPARRSYEKAGYRALPIVRYFKDL